MEKPFLPGIGGHYKALSPGQPSAYPLFCYRLLLENINAVSKEMAGRY